MNKYSKIPSIHKKIAENKLVSAISGLGAMSGIMLQPTFIQFFTHKIIIEIREHPHLS